MGKVILQKFSSQQNWLLFCFPKYVFYKRDEPGDPHSKLFKKYIIPDGRHNKQELRSHNQVYCEDKYILKARPFALIS